MMSFAFWTKWLLGIAVLLVLFGLALAVFNQSFLFESLFNSNIDRVFWGAAVIPQVSLDFQRWVYAVLGATVAGWGAFLVFLAYYPFRRKELWAWNCILVGMLVWYLPDTIFSMQFGVAFNAVFNTILLILVLLPLAFTRREFSALPARHRPRHPRKGAP
jgi:hypothetical protein